MKKLFLTSFAFKTGGLMYTEYRLVVVRRIDIEKYLDLHKWDAMKSDDPAISVVYDKFNEWFPKFFPESELISHIAHPAIE